MPQKTDSNCRVRTIGNRSLNFSTVLVVEVLIALVILLVAPDVVFILFLALLFAILLRMQTRFVVRNLRTSYPVALAIVLSTGAASFTAFGYAFGVQINQQLSESADVIAEARARVSEAALARPHLVSLVRSTPIIGEWLIPEQDTSPESDRAKTQTDSREQTDSNDVSAGETLATRAAGRGLLAVGNLFRTTFGIAINSLLILATGIFLAATPGQYVENGLMMLPPDYRTAASAFVREGVRRLEQWLMARFVSMGVTGLGAWLVLYLCDVPMAFMTGLLTAILTFIPNAGGILSLLVAVLFAVPQGADTVSMVIGGFAVVQVLESYVITPVVQQSQVSLLPASVIITQAILGAVFGFLGAAVASPLLTLLGTMIDMSNEHVPDGNNAAKV
ncbi:MAG: AI-2E family transporter [Planctomycetaceae bacterium]|nr:AI-2E family transporter [Planctomycetaceae bacterium]